MCIWEGRLFCLLQGLLLYWRLASNSLYSQGWPTQIYSVIIVYFVKNNLREKEVIWLTITGYYDVITPSLWKSKQTLKDTSPVTSRRRMSTWTSACSSLVSAQRVFSTLTQSRIPTRGWCCPQRASGHDKVVLLGAADMTQRVKGLILAWRSKHKSHVKAGYSSRLL